MQTIDLHCHTTASDGSLTPTELVVLAAEEGLTAVAVTDHDTVAGLAEAGEAARALNIELVPGIELSLDYPSGQFHMLGLLIDPQSEALGRRLMRLQENRRTRNARMLERLRHLGLPVTMADVEQQAGGGQVGRPHMALALVAKGAAASVGDAFARYLGEGRPAHIAKDKISVDEGIALIHSAGGLAVAAHPGSLGLDDGSLASELQALRHRGLDGVECYYSQHTPERTAALLGIARRAGLLATGGSDFHGAAKPHIRLGQVDGLHPAPDALLAALKCARTLRSEPPRPAQ